MYYIVKYIEFLGLFIIAIGFVMKFPKLMDFKVFLAGGVVFLIGYLMRKFILE